jgi:vancomycin resistance protein YoaR
MSTTETETVFSLEANRTEARLAGQREQLRRTPGERVLALDIEAGAERVRQLRRDHAVHVRVEQERAQADRQRDQDARAELEAKLTSAYIASAPGVSAAEAKAALPDLLHRHRLAEQDRMDAMLAEQRRRLGPAF